MFKDELSIKGVAIGLIGYLVASVSLFAVIFQIWAPNGITDRVEPARLADADQTLLMWQDIIGLVFGLLASFATCLFSGAKGLKNSLILGCLFVLYGVLGIFIHPAHPTSMQLGKIISPIPIALLGGWLCLRFTSARRALRNNA